MSCRLTPLVPQRVYLVRHNHSTRISTRPCVEIQTYLLPPRRYRPNHHVTPDPAGHTRSDVLMFSQTRFPPYLNHSHTRVYRPLTQTCSYSHVSLHICIVPSLSRIHPSIHFIPKKHRPKTKTSSTLFTPRVNQPRPVTFSPFLSQRVFFKEHHRLYHIREGIV
jgi:hypothetical protein